MAGIDDTPSETYLTEGRRATVRTVGVWKVVSVLKQYLPNLWIDVVSARRTGVLGVSNLDPNNPELDRSFDSIVSDFVGTDLAELGQTTITAMCRWFRPQSIRPV